MVRVTSASKKTLAEMRVEIVNEVIRAVLRIEKTILSSQKGVVYVRSREACEEMVARLGCGYYHSSIVEVD